MTFEGLLEEEIRDGFVGENGRPSRCYCGNSQFKME
jgi:hypothetical protein